MMNAKEARQNVETYKQNKRMEVVEKANAYLESLNDCIAKASLEYGKSYIKVESPETEEIEKLATEMLKELEYTVAKLVPSGLKISW